FPADGLISLARMMIVQRLRLPVAQRDWRPVEQVLELAATQLPGSLEVPELRAEVLMSQDKADEARKCLAESAERHPDEVRVWLSRAALEQRLGEWKAAEALLASAEKQVGDSIDLRIGRIRYLVQRPGEITAPELTALATELDGFDKSGQARLCTVLAFTLRSAGEKEKAVELAKRSNALDPDNLPARLFLFDYAMETRDAASMEELIAEIRRIEGPEGGPLSRYGEALRLVIGAKAEDTERLEAARRQLTEARLQRPAWARLPLLEAQIEELRGNTAGAIEFYGQAVDLGLRQAATVQRLVALLFAQRRFAEADQALRKLDDQQTPFTTELGRLASKVSLQVEDFTRAIDMARKTCATSTNFADHVWLGQLAGALARGVRTEAAERDKLNEEADAALRRAVELAPTEPDVWVTLVQHLVRTEQTADADEALEKAVEKIAAEDRPLVLAECYVSMGRREQAAEQFGLALKARPDDVLTLRRASEFHLSRGAFSEGEPLLRRLLEPELKASDADVAFARRGLALVLAADKSYQKLQLAIALLDENLKSNPLSIDDRKDKALLLARSPALADRQLARSTLEELLGQSMPDSSSRLLLAQLYAAGGELPQARRQFQTLLAEAGDNPAYIANYIRILLAGSEIGEADLWMAKLEDLQPASLETKELRARLLVANGDAQAAIELLKGLRSDQVDSQTGSATEEPDNTAATGGSAAAAKKKSPAGPSAERIALLLEGLASSIARRDSAGGTSSIGGRTEGPASAPESKSSEQVRLLQSAAEELLNEAAAAGSRGRAALAGFLGRHGRAADALPIWLEFFGGKDFETAASGCSLLAATQQLNAQQLAEVERQLVKANEAHPESLGVLSALALVYDAQVRYDQAAVTYRGILTRDRDNVVALNNLALNLALRNQPGSDALKLIDRAVAARGPAATLLDTRGTVYLALGKADKAVADLEEAVAQEPSASYYFHLARAHLLRGDRQAAAAALDRAKKAGLREESLHLLERGEYRKVLDSASS
ncbi:MAG TPA: tetratricopeptide repeat protein, partial [Pirellulales bacterium]|nr:tetratricopeptide repeat protein [Pirellulales bacterium]